MSHITTIEVEIQEDLKALAMAAKMLGGKFLPRQKTHKWYGSWQRDYNSSDAAYKNGIDPKDYGKCEHAISFPDSGYEVGLVKMPSGKLKPVWDFWGTGAKLSEHMGKNGGKFLQAYGVAKATIEAKKQGFLVSKKQVGDKIQLTFKK